MLPYDRQKEIVGILRETGHVSIHKLAQLVHVSEPTLRRDLVQMEKQGLVRRTYGGAVTVMRKFVPEDVLELWDKAEAVDVEPWDGVATALGVRS